MSKQYYNSDKKHALENESSYRNDGLHVPHFELAVRIIAIAHRDYRKGNDAVRYDAIKFFMGRWYETLYDYCSMFDVSASRLADLRPPKDLYHATGDFQYAN